MRSRAGAKSVFILIVLAAFAFKLPAAVSRFRLYPDAAAYVNIARNTSTGNGFTSTLKLNYFCPSGGPTGRSGVTHCALSDWPPLYPMLASAVLYVALDEIALQVTNALLVSMAAGLVFLIGDRLFGRRAGLLAALFAAIAPNLFRAGITAMSDPLGLVLALAAVATAVRARGRGLWWIAAGAAAGASYLARYPNAVILPAFVAFLLLRRDERRLIVPCLLGFALAAGPVLLWKCVLYGSPTYGVQSLHYRTLSFRDATWDSYGGALCSSTADFLRNNLGAAVALVITNTGAYAANLLAGIGGLSLLSVGLPALFLGRRGHVLNRERGLLLAIALLSFATYASTWSIPPAQGSRFLLLPYCLLLPFCTAGIIWLLNSRTAVRRVAAVAVCAIVLTAYCHASYVASTTRAGQFNSLGSEAAEWTAVLPRDTVVATNSPWLVSYHTGLPTAALPHNLNRRTLGRFLSEYHVGAVLVLPSKTRSQTLRTLDDETEDFRVVRLGRAFAAVPLARTD